VVARAKARRAVVRGAEVRRVATQAWMHERRHEDTTVARAATAHGRDVARAA